MPNQDTIDRRTTMIASGKAAIDATKRDDDDAAAVLTRCVANTYVGRSERIIEFNDREREDSGGLISFCRQSDGTLLVRIYRTDVNVRVSFDLPDQAQRKAGKR